MRNGKVCSANLTWKKNFINRFNFTGWPGDFDDHFKIQSGFSIYFISLSGLVLNRATGLYPGTPVMDAGYLIMKQKSL